MSECIPDNFVLIQNGRGQVYHRNDGFPCIACHIESLQSENAELKKALLTIATSAKGFDLDSWVNITSYCQGTAQEALSWLEKK